VQQEVERELKRACGTATQPRLLGDDSLSSEQLSHGAALFHRLCVQCHSVNGDAQTNAAGYLNPKPRDFRQGIFKFTSTPYGSKPVPDDLRRTIRDGCLGTGMPSFAWLSENDLSDLVNHVMILAQRGEFERQLAVEADIEGKLIPENVQQLEKQIVQKWADALGAIVTPVSPLVPYENESIERGREAFMTEITGCYRCHGPDGRGYTVPDPTRSTDAPPLRAPDLTSGMLAGGNRPIDLYRRIYAGINGTAMPSYSEHLKSSPETFWDLVNFVQFLENTRRRELQAEQPQESK
jgi:mono/diheme cytochrome c family protein